MTAMSPMCITWCPISIMTVTGLPSRQKKLLLPSQDAAAVSDDDDGNKMIGRRDVGGDGAGTGAGGDGWDELFAINGNNARGREDSVKVGGD